MRIINIEEGSMILEVIGFDNQDGDFFVNLQTGDAKIRISFEDFSKSMRKKWKKLLK
jgi:hypothetical protein